MPRLIITVCAGILFSGCMTHYHRIDGNDMILVLTKPDASRVVLACSLDGFQSRSARHVAGRWEVKLPADASFTYFYRVDGELFVPDCPLKENDDFGSMNCIFDPHL